MTPSALTLILILALAFLLTLPAGAAEEVPFTVPDTPWPQGLGNHRARLRVAQASEAVRAHIPWRRRDPSPEQKGVIVIEVSTGKPVANVALISVTRESGDLVFQAPSVGEYDVYFMPFTADMVNWNYRVHYTPPESKADPDWLERNGLTAAALPAGKWQALPAAEVTDPQARTGFDRFDPMEVIATAEETKALLAVNAGRPYLLFPEDRRCPIRMTDDLPLRWIKSGPSAEFRGEAERGEYYAFQIGLYAAQPIADLAVAFSPLKPAAGEPIPASALTCFNLGGTDWLGRPLKKTVSVAPGKVGALWFGVQIPEGAAPGDYHGALTLRPAGLPESTVSLSLHVTDQVARHAGDDDPYRQSRLRWLNSTIGLDDEVAAPYTPVEVQGDTVKCLGRQVRFGATGLPESIRSNGHEILARPMALVIEDASGQLAPTTGKLKLVTRVPGAVTFEAQSDLGALSATCSTRMEADGYGVVDLTLTAKQPVSLKDVRLEIPFRREIATYMMGMGKKGGLRPPEWKWAWDAGRANNAVWIGDVEAGLQCKLKGPEDTWDIYNLTAGIPQSWGNGGRGGAAVTEESPGVVLLRAYSGERTVQVGEELRFRFGLLVTPVKPLDPAHWHERYYHATVPPETAIASGANIINIHQGNELNPNINYPFLAADKLAAYVEQAHAKGVKVKIYYTVRELSNYVVEMGCLRSLGHEVFVGGGGGGASWLQEHLVSDFSPAWHSILPDGEVDAAIVTTGLSRWHNYYLEGLGWLLDNVRIDGLYLDGIGYDREIMKRVRKVLDRTRPGCLIDFHSGNEFPFGDLRVSPACKYMEHFPYINSLWFGEGYDYNETPDYWLVEVSGLPFGLYGEMLEGNGNPWRGMVYGMTARYYSGADPKHLWKLWDDFGIAEAKMLGYWSPHCPVKTDNKDVLATAYVKQGKTLISVASWAKDQVRCRLSIDWKAVGLDPGRAHLFAPAIPAFQPSVLLKPTDPIPVIPGRGWLFILDEEPHEVPVLPDAYAARKVVLDDQFTGDALGADWKVELSAQAGASLKVADGAVAIEACANCCAFASRPLPAGANLVECLIYSGNDNGASWGPGLSLGWPGKSLRINLRAEGRLGVDDGTSQFLAGVATPNTWYHLRVRVEPDQVSGEMSLDGQFWETIGALPRAQFPGDPTVVRLGKMSPGSRNEDFQVLGPVGACRAKDLRVFTAK